MAVDVERRELDRPVETGIAPERAADIEADHQRRPGRVGPLRRRARYDAERQDQGRDATPHDAPPSTVWVLPVWKIGVLVSTWSSDRNGRLKCGLPMMTTTRKLNPLATNCSTGRVKTSNRATANSTSTIETICPMARVLIASFSTWIQAKLPPMMMNRKNHRSTTRASAFTW